MANNLRLGASNTEKEPEEGPSTYEEQLKGLTILSSWEHQVRRSWDQGTTPARIRLQQLRIVTGRTDETDIIPVEASRRRQKSVGTDPGPSDKAAPVPIEISD